MKKIFIILICLLFISVAVTVVTIVAGDAEKEIKRLKTPLLDLSKQLGNGELVTLQSYQTTSFKGIKQGWYKESPIEVEALLTLPPGDGPFPVLLLTHSSE